MITAERLKELIRYDPLAGVFTWRHRPKVNGPQVVEGKVAGMVDSRGYVRIGLLGKAYGAHRLAWLYMTGEMPEHDIDHVNRDRSDNKWGNLRLATPSQNAVNSPVRTRSLPRGVVMHRRCGRYQAGIKVKGRSIHLGLFDFPDEAHRAYRAASLAHHGEFSPYFERKSA